MNYFRFSANVQPSNGLICNISKLDSHIILSSVNKWTNVGMCIMMLQVTPCAPGRAATHDRIDWIIDIIYSIVHGKIVNTTSCLVD